MRNNPRDWRFAEIKNLLEYYGFEMRTRGSHCVFVHPDLDQILSIPYARPVLPVYVEKVLEFLDELFEKEGGEV